MTNKEQIIIDGVDVSECAYFDYENEGTTECDAYGNECEANNCYFKQLARKTQECEELKNELDLYKTWYRAKHDDVKNLLGRYRKALEEIEEIAKDGLNPICYKSNCSRCKCYNGDDCKAGMISLINNYFTENGEFADENGDFIEALEALIESERKKCNKAIPITQQVLDIIDKVKGEENGR